MSTSPPALTDQILLFQNLARFLKSGVPLSAGLAHVQEQCSAAMRPVLAGMQDALEKRHLPLSEAFREHYPGADAFLLAVVEQGEASGHLDLSFKQLEDAATQALDRR